MPDRIQMGPVRIYSCTAKRSQNFVLGRFQCIFSESALSVGPPTTHRGQREYRLDFLCSVTASESLGLQVRARERELQVSIRDLPTDIQGTGIRMPLRSSLMGSLLLSHPQALEQHDEA